jgi:hypothetical protein
MKVYNHTNGDYGEFDFKARGWSAKTGYHVTGDVKDN